MSIVKKPKATNITFYPNAPKVEVQINKVFKVTTEKLRLLLHKYINIQLHTTLWHILTRLKLIFTKNLPILDL
jgi:hypothetical protein